MSEITKIKETVLTLLQNHSFLRDDDERLIGNIWANDMQKLKLNPSTTSAESFLRHFVAGNITNADSITRARRNLQQEHKELRGNLWYKRHKAQRNVQEELGYKI